MEVSKAINKIILMFGKPLILHTDNGKEFVNERISRLCDEYKIKHVRGRARCPWVQGQVERLNQSLKYMLSSTCLSENLDYKWISIIDRITSSYNSTVHSTTSFAPFRIMFGENADQSANIHYSEEELNLLFADLDSSNMDEKDDVENYMAWKWFTVSSTRTKAVQYSDAAEEKMLKKNMWKNDTSVFKIGEKVVRRIKTDKNKGTRKRYLNEHHDTRIYNVKGFSPTGMVILESEDGREIQEDSRDLASLETN
ncbi:uncharacterized protein LOC115229103 [Octopus sinensis]|uniref:Uncharacterized protein LOC115229103 n=1 Tax=Octopus sinensis TaxID=2607531 RepID=A0A6P7U3B7_9MOLL|nr:uncharacterized protein LOC115229103 [Octopus sinensis]